MSDDEKYVVAVVSATHKWFTPLLPLDEAQKAADRYNNSPSRKAVVIGVPR